MTTEERERLAHSAELHARRFRETGDGKHQERCAAMLFYLGNSVGASWILACEMCGVVDE